MLRSLPDPPNAGGRRYSGIPVSESITDIFRRFQGSPFRLRQPECLHPAGRPESSPSIRPSGCLRRGDRRRVARRGKEPGRNGGRGGLEPTTYGLSVRGAHPPVVVVRCLEPPSRGRSRMTDLSSGSDRLRRTGTGRRRPAPTRCPPLWLRHGQASVHTRLDHWSPLTSRGDRRRR
jgi:hypothetical protein